MEIKGVDFAEVTLEEMSKDEAMALVKFITKGASMQIGDEIMEYLLSKIQQYVPYFIQVIIDRCDMNLQTTTAEHPKVLRPIRAAWWWSPVALDAFP